VSGPKSKLWKGRWESELELLVIDEAALKLAKGFPSEKLPMVSDRNGARLARGQRLLEIGLRIGAVGHDRSLAASK